MCNVTYILLNIKRIVHYVGILKSLYYDARSVEHQKFQGNLETSCIRFILQYLLP